MIVAGFGFRVSASVESLTDALAQAAGGRRVDLIATAADKAGAAAFLTLSARLGVEVRAVEAEALATVDTSTQSPAALSARNVGSLAEAAALAAAGPGGRLIGARVISRDRLASCALATGE